MGRPAASSFSLVQPNQKDGVTFETGGRWGRIDPANAEFYGKAWISHASGLAYRNFFPLWACYPKEEMRPEMDAQSARLNDAVGRNKEATVEIGNLENALEAASVKAAKMEDAEKRASEANLKINSLQHELSRLEKIESRYEGQMELVSTLQDQGKTLKEQNSLLSKEGGRAFRRLKRFPRRSGSEDYCAPGRAFAPGENRSPVGCTDKEPGRAKQSSDRQGRASLKRV